MGYTSCTHVIEEVLSMAEDAQPAERTDRSPWNWLLFIPIVLPLVVAVFNAESPTLFGFPRFYWLQLAFIVVGVATTTLVYQLTKKR
jgi:hypothetical protein